MIAYESTLSILSKKKSFHRINYITLITNAKVTLFFDKKTRITKNYLFLIEISLFTHKMTQRDLQKFLTVFAGILFIQSDSYMLEKILMTEKCKNRLFFHTDLHVSL